MIIFCGNVSIYYHLSVADVILSLYQNVDRLLSKRQDPDVEIWWSVVGTSGIELIYHVSSWCIVVILIARFDFCSIDVYFCFCLCLYTVIVHVLTFII